jgi:hypothetical protein
MSSTGKPLEEKIQEAGKLLQENHPAFLDRIYDTTSAGSLLPPRPGDFYLLLQGTMFLIEAKSSEKHRSFMECSLKKMIRPTQIACHRLWMRAGGQSLFIFHYTAGERVEFWDGKVVVDAYLGVCPKKESRPWRESKYRKEDLAEVLLGAVSV